MNEPEGDEFASGVEAELHRKLEIVRADRPQPPAALEPRIFRTLRWQSAIVTPLTGALAMIGGLLAGFRVIAGLKSRNKAS